MDLKSLTLLNMVLFVPAFNLVRVTDSDLTWSQMGLVAAAMLIAEVALAVPLWWVLRIRHVPARTASVMILTSVIFNSGNFGIPLAERAFGVAGGAVQALILMTANVSVWVLGYLLLTAAHRPFHHALGEVVRTPVFLALIAALGLKAFNVRLPETLHYPLSTIALGLVPLALVTLGAQLAMRQGKPNWRLVGPVVATKLIGLPLVMTGVVFALGLWPWPGGMLIVASSAPSAVNALLLAVELDGDSEVAADAILWTTLLCSITVTFTLAVVRMAGGVPPP